MSASEAPPAAAVGLSARVLILVVIFVMIAEVLIYVPSISRFRKVWLDDKIRDAGIAVLAARASPEGKVTVGLAMEILDQTGAHAIALKTPDRRMLMLTNAMPPEVDVTVDVTEEGFFPWIAGAFDTLVQRNGRVLRILAPAPGQGEGASIEVLIDEAPLREAMLGYSQRILQLSIIISLITAGLVFLSLRWLLIRPIRRITDSLMRFRANPDDESATPPASRRRDEIGMAERELRAMQTDLRAALRQKTRLAALGAAVARINHDLRNILATAMLTSDRLATSADPEVQRLAPRLLAAIDRAATLCERTLQFVQGNADALRPSAFRLEALLAELRAAHGDHDGAAALAGDGLELAVVADRAQLFRVFSNLTLNAVQAGARQVRIIARSERGRVLIDVIDDGPGIPETIRPRLFEPFVTARQSGGSGLGLAIAKEIVEAHGGDLVIAATGPEGTTFRLDLPAAPALRLGERRVA